MKDINHLLSFWNDVHIEYQKTGVSEYEEIKLYKDHYQSMGMDPINFMERNQKKLMDMFHDVCTSYIQINNTSGHNEDDFLSLSQNKSYGMTWGVYYLHLWLGICDNLNDFVIRVLPSG